MTIDKSRLPEAERPPLPEFLPVPRKYRHDGWTPERQAGFIEALSDTGSVKAAAHAVNMTPEGAYYLRQPGAESFRAAWEAALRHGVRRLTDVGLERALHGVEVPVYHFGAVVGTRRVYNDRLLMFYLRNRLPSCSPRIRATPSSTSPRCAASSRSSGAPSGSSSALSTTPATTTSCSTASTARSPGSPSAAASA